MECKPLKNRIVAVKLLVQRFVKARQVFFQGVIRHVLASVLQALRVRVAQSESITVPITV